MTENTNDVVVNDNTNDIQNDVETDDAPVVSFDELLQDPEYQREFDKKIAKALDTSKAKWQAEADAKREEAEKLAQMSAAEKHQFEMDKAIRERDNALRDLNSYKLKDAAISYATDKGMDARLVDLIDFSNADADSVKEKIDNLYDVVKKATEQGVNEKLRQLAPKNYASQPKTSGQAYMDKKYGNNPFYKK